MKLANRPKIAFIGAGSTVFLRNVVSDIFLREELSDAHVALMDINPERLAEARAVTDELVSSLAPGARISAHECRQEALAGADFVLVAFQIGGYEPCTVADFEIPRRFGLRQTIADTLGLGGIMRGLRTVPHLWALCDDMRRHCPGALLLQYVNPMAINVQAIAARYPDIAVVGLCHSVQRTITALAHDLELSPQNIRFRCAGINHMAFFLKLEEIMPDGCGRDLYPDLLNGYAEGRLPRPERLEPRCPDTVRYEIMKRFGYFVTESSEHFAEYVPWFIKRDRPDLVETFGIPLDEYCLRCEEQIALWKQQGNDLRAGGRGEPVVSDEYAADIIHSSWVGTPSAIYGNVANDGHIASLPEGCTVEVPCLVDRHGVQPVAVGHLPPQLTALMRTSVNVQELVVAALLEERRDHIHHAAAMDPHTAAELDLRQIHDLVDALTDAHRDWIPAWAAP